MKLRAISVVCILLFHHAARVESRHPYHNWYNMFVFGDSFADDGNVPDNMGQLSRAWHYPYGLSFAEYNGRTHFYSTGRFSNYMVQSDFIAKILGIHEAPHAYNRSFLQLPHYGMTFATGGSGVLEAPQEVPTLGQQVDSFEKLLRRKIISPARLPDSVFLIAISGNDYMPTVSLLGNSFGNVTAAISETAGKVTNGIVANVKRLRKLGAKKILVNNMHPLGCTPRRTRPSNYTSCDDHGNMVTSIHNSNLKQKLRDSPAIRILDLNTAFTNIINGTSESSPLSEQFTNKLKPCCVAEDPEGFCGELAGPFEHLYKLDGANVKRYFYWDDMHPTHAGWEVVMAQLEGTIKDFLNMN
uniref:GDSL esterase/lipase n=1 Tax=Hordeum vulgare subsp. vulgare TaxID=112509 RepID=A0A8I6X1D2_HORVV